MDKITLPAIGANVKTDGSVNGQMVALHDMSDTAHAAIREILKPDATASEIKAALLALGDNYKDVYAIASTLKTFLEARDTADSTINTWREIEDFLNGLTDRESLVGLMEQEHQKLTNNFNAKLSEFDDKKVGSTSVKTIAGPMTAEEYAMLEPDASTLYIVTD